MILVNGKPEDALRVHDRGFQYGDGVFETIAVSNGRPRLLQRHLGRLNKGCAALGFSAPRGEDLQKEIETLCRGVSRGVLKVIVTRGLGQRGYCPPPDATPTRVLMRTSWPEFPSDWWRHGVTVRLCRTRLGRNRALAGIKHLNRLEQVLARMEWRDPDIAEGLMRDDRGRVIEGVTSNLFIVRGERLITPDLSESGVEGVVRGLILDLGTSLGFAHKISELTVEDILKADEAFLTNSLIGIWPIRRFEARCYGRGEVTRRLMGHLEAELEC